MPSQISVYTIICNNELEYGLLSIAHLPICFSCTACSSHLGVQLIGPWGRLLAQGLGAKHRQRQALPGHSPDLGLVIDAPEPRQGWWMTIPNITKIK